MIGFSNGVFKRISKGFSIIDNDQFVRYVLENGK